MVLQQSPAEHLRELAVRVRTAPLLTKSPGEIVGEAIAEAVKLGALSELSFTIATIDKLTAEELAGGWTNGPVGIRVARTRNTAVFIAALDAYQVAFSTDRGYNETEIGCKAVAERLEAWAERLEALEPSATAGRAGGTAEDESGAKSAGGGREGLTITAEVKALAMLIEHPDWTDAEIARVVGCSRSSLYRWDRFTRARGLLREGRKGLPKTGDR